jgi:hypothetical protein
LFAQIEEARRASPLPEGPDRAGAEALTVEILKDALFR